MHEQQADMMCLVADLRQLRKPQNKACVTIALELKRATLPPTLQGRVGKERAGIRQKECVGLALLLPWELEGRNSHLNLHFVPDIWHQEITNLREDAVSSHLHLLFGPEGCKESTLLDSLSPTG